MKRLAIILVAALALASCTKFREDFTAVKTFIASAAEATVNPKFVMVGAESFDTLQDIATIYVQLPRCNGKNRPACSYYYVVAKIRPAIKAGRQARDRAEQFIADHPDKLGSAGLYDSVIAAGRYLQDLINANGVRTAVANVGAR